MISITDSHKKLSISNLNEYPLLERQRPFIELMMKYNCALREVSTKFEVLDDEFSIRYNRNPVESIRTRIKSPRSIVEKLERKGYDVSIENIRDHIHDVAGARIICSFPEDIYMLAEMFMRQDDITVVEIKDYIKNPKPSGYRSYHLIIDIPVFLTESRETMRVEVQFRTIAMEFWASLEHKLKYKKDIDSPHAEEIAHQLKECSDRIAALDLEMQGIRNKIEE
ncbi:MAG: GTP pyrophosphokinase family protein [Clostridia bacterium]|nr:GTP pyrophosphokinase family protein [Clostridia bacterium]